MSGKLPTVITYHADPTEPEKVEIKCERLKENTGRGSIKRRPLVPKQPQSDCGNIRNPWFLRCGVVFVAVVFAVIFVALYSKMHAKVENMEVKLSHFESIIAAMEEKVNEMNDRIHCSVIRLNGTDKRGGSCAQYTQLLAKETSKARPTKKVQTTNSNKRLTTNAQNPRRTNNVKSNLTREDLNTVYVAWGVTKCPDSKGTRTLYSGTVASSDKSVFLCLSSSLYYQNPKDIGDADRAQLHPVRYGDSMVLFEPPWNRTRNYARKNSEVPCAVCRHSGRSAVLVRPAAANCPTGEWQREYRGYLMTSEAQQQRTEFICVNTYAESKQTEDSRLRGPVSRLQFTQYDYEPAEKRTAALACVVCLI